MSNLRTYKTRIRNILCQFCGYCIRGPERNVNKLLSLHCKLKHPDINKTNQLKTVVYSKKMTNKNNPGYEKLSSGNITRQNIQDTLKETVYIKNINNKDTYKYNKPTTICNIIKDFTEDKDYLYSVI